MAEWITTKEAARILNTSVRNVVNRISQGKLKAKRDGKRWLVHESLEPASVGTVTESEGNLKEAFDELLKQIEQKDKQIDSLQRQLEAAVEADERHDMIVMQLTKQLGDSQRLIEYHESPWWRRWFGSRKKPKD